MEAVGTSSSGLPLRVGPFRVAKELLRAPGVVLAEARDADGERRMLQLVRLRAPTDDVERNERMRIERQIAQRTAELVMGADVVVHAHGGADAERGERILFWALPISDGPSVMDWVRKGLLSVGELLDLGVLLADRMILRHTKLKPDPHLSEQLVRLDEAGKPSLAGVPIAVTHTWLAADQIPPRFLPEEIIGGANTRGDVYRLAQLLISLAERLGVPGSVEAGLSTVAGAPTAEEARARILTIRGSLYESEEPTQMRPAVPAEGNGEPTALRSWPLVEVTPAELDATPVRSLDPNSASEAETRESEPMTPLPGSEASVIPVFADEVITVDEQKPKDEASVDPAEVSRPVPTVEERPQPVLPVPELVADANSNPYAPEPLPAPASGEPLYPSERAAIDVLAAAWTGPVVTPGESPWSEVVSPRGAHRRAQDSFHGISGEIPRPSDQKPVAAVSTPPGSGAVAWRSTSEVDDSSGSWVAETYKKVDSGEIEAEIAAAISGFDTKKVVAAVLAVLVIFGVFALIARSGDHSERDDDTLVAPPANEFTLESDPAGATVVAEADGRTLGKTPLHFLVPAGAKSGVFLVQTGYEPLRLDLPERGGLNARLSRIETPDCELNITSVDGTAFEGVGLALSSGARVRVPGAALVRPKEDTGMEGARLVLCPALGGEPITRLRFARRGGVRSVRITEPAGASAFVNSEPVGRVPANGRATFAFSLVRVDDASGMSEERFVPTQLDVEVRMPTPRLRKLPTIVVPDDQDALTTEDEAEGQFFSDRAASVRERVLASENKPPPNGRSSSASSTAPSSSTARASPPIRTSPTATSASPISINAIAARERRARTTCVSSSSPRMPRTPLACASSSVTDVPQTWDSGSVSPEEALARLAAGNKRFREGRPEAGVRTWSPEMATQQQRPFAIILGCSDSRTPVEILFDQGFGDLFVIRIAGNIVAPSVVGSIEFAASQFGSRLVVVMGHTRCGAVGATVRSLETGDLSHDSRNIRSITDRIAPHIAGLIQPGHDERVIREAVRANVHASVDHLRHGSRIIEDLVLSGRVSVVGAEYELETGAVHILEGKSSKP